MLNILHWYESLEKRLAVTCKWCWSAVFQPPNERCSFYHHWQNVLFLRSPVSKNLCDFKVLCILLKHDFNHTSLPKQAQVELCRVQVPQAAPGPTGVIEARVLSNRHMEPDAPEPSSLITSLAANEFKQLSRSSHRPVRSTNAWLLCQSCLLLKSCNLTANCHFENVALLGCS